jgi:energy-coupling factor transport system substrate-specific component
VNTTAFAVLALKASRRSVGRSPAWIASQQNPDGGFNFAGRGGQSGVDDTSAPLQALVAAGGHRTAIARAARFLERQENPDGGFPLSPGAPSNAQSTAWAVQGLLAAGRPVTRPLRYLRGLTAPSGAVRYSRTSTQTPVWVTAQALAAFAREPFPLHPVSRRSAPTARPVVPTATAAARRTPRPTATPGARETQGPEPSVSLEPIARRAGRLTALVL